MSNNVVSFDEYRTKTAHPTTFQITNSAVSINKAGCLHVDDKLEEPERLTFELDTEAGLIFIRPDGPDGDYKHDDRPRNGYGLSYGSDVIRDFFVEHIDCVERSDLPVRAEMEYWSDEHAMVVSVENFEGGDGDSKDNESGHENSTDSDQEQNESDNKKNLPENSDLAEELGRQMAKDGEPQDANPYDLSVAPEENLYFAWKDGWEDYHSDE